MYLICGLPEAPSHPEEKKRSVTLVSCDWRKKKKVSNDLAIPFIHNATMWVLKEVPWQMRWGNLTSLILCLFTKFYKRVKFTDKIYSEDWIFLLFFLYLSMNFINKQINMTRFWYQAWSHMGVHCENHMVNVNISVSQVYFGDQRERKCII